MKSRTELTPEDRARFQSARASFSGAIDAYEAAVDRKAKLQEKKDELELRIANKAGIDPLAGGDELIALATDKTQLELINTALPQAEAAIGKAEKEVRSAVMHRGRGVFADYVARERRLWAAHITVSLEPFCRTLERAGEVAAQTDLMLTLGNCLVWLSGEGSVNAARKCIDCIDSILVAGDNPFL